MLFAIVFLFVPVWADESALEKSIQKCSDQAKWGYYRPLIYEKPAVDLYSAKDLYGKFKTKDICETDRSKYNKMEAHKKCPGTKGCTKDSASPCEQFRIGNEISGIIYSSDFVFTLGRSTTPITSKALFSNQEKCMKAIQEGGEFKVFGDAYRRKIGVKNSKNKFLGICKTEEIVVCEKDKTYSENPDIN